MIVERPAASGEVAVSWLCIVQTAAAEQWMCHNREGFNIQGRVHRLQGAPRGDAEAHRKKMHCGLNSQWM